jgi:hypothetical protein
MRLLGAGSTMGAADRVGREVQGMARTRRTIAIATLTSAMAVTLLVGPGARAQDFPFCAILSAAEVSAAVGAEVAPTYGDDRSCTYGSSAEDVFTMLSVTNGGTQMTIAKEIYTDGEDTTVAGQPAYLLAGGFSNVLYIDRGDGDTLSFQLLGQPESVDPAAALVGLGELAFPRLGTLVIPTPTPFVQQDPELAALFPADIGGTPVTVETMTEGLTLAEEQRAQVEQLLGSQGKTLDDLSAGFAFGMDPQYFIYALRVKGADASALRDPFLAMSGAAGAPTPAQVAGKDVMVATISDQTQHVYAKGDVLWLVGAQEPILTEIFQKLP